MVISGLAVITIFFTIIYAIIKTGDEDEKKIIF